MSKLKLLAIGSPFQLDRVSWIMANALTHNKIKANVDIKLLDRPGINLLKEFSQEPLLIIDAVYTNGEFGQIVEFPINENNILKIKQSQVKAYSSHSLGLAQSLELSIALDQMPKNARFLGFNINNVKDARNNLKLFRNFKEHILKVILSKLNEE